ncbi:MAG TPA: ATP-binding cassette domain-containing protein, partial [Savagea sp.]
MRKTVVDVQNLTFTYASYEEEKTNKPALQDVSFRIEEGEWIAIVGHNGSGKSTLAKHLIGLLFPNEGTVSLFGEQLTEETLWELRARLGIVFQNPDNQFVGSTVQDDVAFSLENQGIPYEEMHRRVKNA